MIDFGEIGGWMDMLFVVVLLADCDCVIVE